MVPGIHHTAKAYSAMVILSKQWDKAAKAAAELLKLVPNDAQGFMRRTQIEREKEAARTRGAGR